MPALARTLNAILVDHIRALLPSLRVHLEESAERRAKELAVLGDAPPGNTSAARSEPGMHQRHRHTLYIGRSAACCVLHVRRVMPANYSRGSDDHVCGMSDFVAMKTFCRHEPAVCSCLLTCCTEQDQAAVLQTCPRPDEAFCRVPQGRAAAAAAG